MKVPVIVPAVALSAAAAFALGWTLRPTQDSADSDGERPDGKSGYRTTARSGGTGSRPLSPTAGKSARGQDEFVDRILAARTPEEMKAAIKAMTDENDPLRRREMFTALLENLTAENARDAYTALRESRRGRGGPGRDRNEEELGLLLNTWGRLDGAGAVAALNEMRESRDDDGERERGGRGGRGGDRGGDGGAGEIVSVLSGWATVDSAGAVNYLNGLEEGRDKQVASFGILRGMLVNGVDEAMGFISSLPTTEDGRARTMFTAMVAGEMLEQGTEAAKGWVDSISDPELKAGALSRVAESVMREDLDGAVEWITQYAGDESAERAVSRVAGEWAEEDPQAALDWASNLPEAAQGQVYERAIGEWVRQDAVAAGEYVQAMSPSEAKDAALEGFSTTLAWREPATAAAWAETISDPDMRTETLTEVAQAWMRTDRTAATEWLESSGLPAEAVQAVTEAPQRGGDGGRRGGGPGGRGGRGR